MTTVYLVGWLQSSQGVFITPLVCKSLTEAIRQQSKLREKLTGNSGSIRDCSFIHECELVEEEDEC